VTEAQKALYRMPVTIIVVVSLILAVAILIAAIFLFRSRREKKAAKAGGAIDWQRQGQQPDAALQQQPGGWGTQQGAGWGVQNPAQQQTDSWGAPSPFPQQSGSWGAPQQQRSDPWATQGESGMGQQPALPASGSSGLGQSWGQPAQDDRTITGHEFGRVPARNLASEYLQFTAFHPRVVPTARWSTLLVYAYIESAMEAIRVDAAKFKDELGPVPVEANVWTSQPVTRGMQFTIVPTCQGIIFNPERASFTWIEDWHQAKFRFRADKRLAGTTANGEITIYAGPLMIASLKISLRFAEQSTAPTDGDIRNRAEVSAYLYKRIFASYSHSDTPVVLACRNVFKAIGFESLIDIDTLRSGQRWNAELMKLIETADLFQLFWSVNASQSPYVRQEWQYALQRSEDEGFIRPVYWEKPLVSPPGELLHLHFAYIELPRLETATERREAPLGMIRIEQGKEPGRIYEIRKDTWSIGRSRTNDLFLEDLSVSRLHAIIISTGNGNYALRDEGSANGTKVNGQLVSKSQALPLTEGDRIQIGQTVFVFFKR
jgi:hypothetical protein